MTKCEFCGKEAIGMYKMQDGLRLWLCKNHSKGKRRVWLWWI